MQQQMSTSHRNINCKEWRGFSAAHRTSTFHVFIVRHWWVFPFAKTVRWNIAFLHFSCNLLACQRGGVWISVQVFAEEAPFVCAHLLVHMSFAGWKWEFFAPKPSLPGFGDFDPCHLRPVIIKPVGRIFEISDSNPIRRKCGKCGRPLSPYKNKGLRRLHRAKARKTRKMRKMRTRKRGKRGKCGWVALMWLALGDPHLTFVAGADSQVLSWMLFVLVVALSS